MRRNVLCIGILSVVLLFMTACGEVQEEKGTEGVSGSGITVNDPKAIEYLCQALNVSEDELRLYHNFTDNAGLKCFDIGIEGDRERSGTYLIQEYESEYDGREYWRVLKKAAAGEIETQGIETARIRSEYMICRVIYDSKLERELEGLVPEKPTIDDSFVEEYNETLLGTDPIWESYSGYIDTDGNYKVSYIGDVSNGWRQGVFKEGKWKTWQMPALEEDGPDYNFFGGGDDRIWYYSEKPEKLLKVFNKKGRKTGELDLIEWGRKYGMVDDTRVNINVLNGTKAIVAFVDGQEKERYFLVDVAKAKVEKEYDKPVSGACYGDFVYDYLGSETDILKITNWKTGEMKECLDLSEIRKENFGSGNYMAYDKEAEEVFELCNDDIPGIEDGNRPIKVCVYENTLYLAYASGVYRYRPDEKKLEKILDGRKQPQFEKMYGDFDIGKDGKMYLLGFLGGGDDEGATDFLYLTRKVK